MKQRHAPSDAVLVSGVAKAARSRKATPHRSAQASVSATAASDAYENATASAGLPPSGATRKNSVDRHSPRDGEVGDARADRGFESAEVGLSNSAHHHAASPLDTAASGIVHLSSGRGPVMSVVSKEAAYSYNPAVLQRQLHTALQRVSAYKKANDLLQQKLDGRNIEQAVEKYRALLLEKEQQISDLQSENSSLRQIAHSQGRKLQDTARKEMDPLDTELTQEKQIEIMVMHVRKIRAKLIAAYEKQHELEAENDKLKSAKQKSSKKCARLRREARELREMNEELRQHLINALNGGAVAAATASVLERQKQQERCPTSDGLEDEDSTADFRHFNQELDSIAEPDARSDADPAVADHHPHNSPRHHTKTDTVQQHQHKSAQSSTATAAATTVDAPSADSVPQRDVGDLLQAAGIPLHLLSSTQSASSSRRYLRSSTVSKPRSNAKVTKENDRLAEENAQMQLRLQALQKNLDVHRATSQHELQLQRATAGKAVAEQKRMAKELNKRELFARTQVRLPLTPCCIDY